MLPAPSPMMMRCWLIDRSALHAQLHALIVRELLAILAGFAPELQRLAPTETHAMRIGQPEAPNETRPLCEARKDRR